MIIPVEHMQASLPGVTMKEPTIHALRIPMDHDGAAMSGHHGGHGAPQLVAAAEACDLGAARVRCYTTDKVYFI